MSATNKKVFDISVDGKPVKVAVLRPNNRVALQADLEYKRAYRKAVESGLMIRMKAEKVLAEQWGQERTERYAALVVSLLSGERALAAGGMPLSKARELAIQMRVTRDEQREMLKERNAVDANTAEAHAEQEKFNYLVASCTVYADSGAEYYAGVEDYLTREDDPAGLLAASHMARLMYGLDDEFEKNLPENRFLVEHKLADPKSLHLVRRKDGKPVDAQGRLVDDYGRLVTENGELISADGTPLTEQGEYKLERLDFIDDLDDGYGEPKLDVELTPAEKAVAEELDDEDEIAQQVAA